MLARKRSGFVQGEGNGRDLSTCPGPLRRGWCFFSFMEKVGS